MGKRSSKKRQSKRGQARTRSRKYNAQMRRQQRAAGSSVRSQASIRSQVSSAASSDRHSSRKASAKRRVSSKAKRRRTVLFILLLMIIMIAAFVFLFKKFDPDKPETKKESTDQTKTEKIQLPENERASYFAELLESRDINIIADHPVDLDEALTAFLVKARNEDPDAQSSSANEVSDRQDSEQGNDIITVNTSGDYDQSVPGGYAIKIRLKDRADDKKTVKLQLGVKDINNEKDNYSFLTQKGFLGVHRRGITTIDGVTIANKTFRVPKKYGRELTKDAFEAFEKMQCDAAEDGVNIYIMSDYRPYADQKLIYEEYRKKHGTKEADKYSARPGYSEHQIGEAIDINYTDESFADTPEGKWVNKNCSKYGYVIRYPDGKADESMYIYEPWHLRYVGKKLAKKLYNNGDWITLEDYFGIDSNYSDDLN